MQTSTFGADNTVLKKAVEESVMLRCQLRPTRINVYKPTSLFVESTSVVLNATNNGSTLNKKTVVLIYHFVREKFSNNVVEVKKIHTSNNFEYPLTKPLMINDFYGFYHECMVNR